MLNEVQRLMDSVDYNNHNKDSYKDIFKDIYRCDLDKPCVQYCVSDPSHCGVLSKGKLDRLDKAKKYKLKGDGGK